MQKRIKPCPVCGYKWPRMWRVTEGGHGYFVECDLCWRCGKTRRTRWGARRAWNRSKRPERIEI